MRKFLMIYFNLVNKENNHIFPILTLLFNYKKIIEINASVKN